MFVFEILWIQLTVSVKVLPGQLVLEVGGAVLIGSPDVEWTSPCIQAVLVTGGVSVVVQDTVVPIHPLCDLVLVVPGKHLNLLV